MRLGIFESVASVKSQFLPAVAEGAGVFAGISASAFVTGYAMKGIDMLPDLDSDGTIKGYLKTYAAPAVPLAVGLFVMPMVERKVSNPYVSRTLRGVRMGMVVYSFAKLLGPALNSAFATIGLPQTQLAGYGGPGLGVEHYLNGAPQTVTTYQPSLRGAPMSIERLNGAPVTVSNMNPIGRTAAILGA